MTQRRPIVGGNWKMNTNLDAGRTLASSILAGLGDLASSCDVVVFPPFPYLLPISECLADGPIKLGAQDVWHEPDGAFTGEVSASMLLDLGVSHVLVGHSERRHVIGEDDGLVNRKLCRVLESGLCAVLCLGETLEQREAGQTEQVNLDQLHAGLDGVDAAGLERVVIAYEPVWAIGAGRTATPEDAQSVHRVIRRALESRYDERNADRIRIQYGGSVKASNAAALFSQPDIDGGLIGGASLKAEEFLSIVRAASETAAGTVGRQTGSIDQ